MLDVEKTTGLGTVDDLIEGVGFRASGSGIEGNVFGREVVVGLWVG